MSLRVVITGANRGIGLEMARQLSARGDRVLATCRTPDNAAELAALEVEVAALDVTDPRAVEDFVGNMAGQPIDILINNAGVGVGHRPLGQLDYDRIARFLATNAIAPLRLAEALIPNLRSGDRKLIANLTSRMGSIADNTSGDAYGYRASKAALNMFSRSLAIDLAAEGICCVVLHPGWVQTAMGGASAPTSVEASVTGLLRVIDRVGAAESGGFFDFNGELVPW